MTRCQMMTANRLGDGEVVYLTATGSWSEALAAAGVSQDETQELWLSEQGARGERERLVVGAYLMPVARNGDGPWRPVSQREAIRARGPSVRLDLGKQAGPMSVNLGAVNVSL